MRRVLFVFGTRPEAIKLAPVMVRMAADPRFSIALCASGQHRDLVRPVLDLFGLSSDHDLGLMRAGQSIGHVTTAILERLPAVLAAAAPDLVVVQGDTTTAFAAALAAFYQRIEVAHVEAGLRTGDLASPWPEEGNRALIGRLARHHFAPTPGARDHLRREAVGGRVVVTGNTVVDAARMASERLGAERSAALAATLWRGDGAARILFTMHRRESFGAPAEAVLGALARIARTRPVDILYPLHPNPAVQGAARALCGGLPNLRLVAPLGYDETIAALQSARLLVTDSGGLAEEAPGFALPALILRTTTERPESLAAGGALLVGQDGALLEAMVAELLTDGPRYAAMRAAPNPFGDGRAAERIVEALARRPRRARSRAA